MKLFRLFLLLLLLSLAGVAVTQYLRQSAGTEVAFEQPAAPGAKSLGTGSSGADAPVARSVTRNAYSQNVDVASSVSIVSSVISALGALVSAFFSWARYRRAR